MMDQHDILHSLSNSRLCGKGACIGEAFLMSLCWCGVFCKPVMWCDLAGEQAL